ncbi:winged helix-turn-helix domain-containing protein [Undibacter mobilis]|uniref:Transcriptional regulator CadC n=1 Tax=Undibacter mobilis TaxID=2292256 RepID=A0A371BC05_9BRAD|nr:winged helix-turn-helix domain-containing protein [Undibacter mobilis]RDV05057.1 transcriptional regulator CadC [Undibacter mobilis]
MSTVLRFAGFEVDPQRAELRRPDGQTVKIRPKPFTMLQFLLANAGRVVGKQELMEAVWPNVFVSEDNLFQCIREIRAAIGDERRQILKVVSGRGYLLDAAVESPSRPVVPDDDRASPAAAVTVESPPAVPDDLPLDAGRPRQAHRTLVVAAALAVFAIGLAVAAPFIGQRFASTPPVVAVMPFADASSDPQVALMAANITDQLVDGLSKIPSLRVLAPKPEPGATAVALSVMRPDYVLRGEIQKSNGAWNVQARIVDAATDEVRWATAFPVESDTPNVALQQSRIAAGVGYAAAAKLNALQHTSGSTNDAAVVIDQAQAFINRTSPEKFKTALAMLDKALAATPANVDLKAELAAQLLRGIQTAWFSGAEAEQAETRARELLEGALKSEPDYLPLLQGYCRFLTATNHFVDSLVACSRALNQDPWDGLVLFQLGLTHIQLGRYDDALSAFMLADRYDTPQVSRWTWLLGVGLTYVFMDRSEEALPWLERSIAITPGTGRTHFLLAAAYQRLGRFDEARAAIAAGMKIRPGTTAANVSLPKKNASATFLARGKEINELLIAAGMPRGEARTSAAQ